MSWKRWTIGFLLAVALLIAAVVFVVVGVTDMYDRVMGR